MSSHKLQSTIRVFNGPGGSPKLMRLPLSSKFPAAGMTYEKCETEDPKKLCASNIAVRLGTDYGNLCAIDFDGIETSPKSGKFIVDPDDILNEFFILNPHLKYSLRTKGRKGATVWVKVEGDYPSRVKHLNIANHEERVGELRFNLYSLIQGIHPDTGNPYKVVVDAPAFNVSLGDITWLDGSTLGKVIGKDPPLLHRNTHDVYTVYEGSLTALQSIVNSYIPTAPHQTADLHFKLARHIKTWERDHQVKLKDQQLMKVGIMWYKATPKKYLKHYGPDKYAIEFIDRYRCVKTCIGDGGETFDNALKAAHENDCHDRVAEFFPLSKDVQLASNLCRELAIASGNGSFFLSVRKLQAALELPNHMAAHRILKCLKTISAIKEVNKGNMKRRRASYYSYLLDDLNTEDKAA